jgi:hypothetical protein
VQTVLIQLASPLDFGYYVPTPKALQGGGYSAIVEQSLVGPEDGQALVERTVPTINEVWKRQPVLSGTCVLSRIWRTPGRVSNYPR